VRKALVICILALCGAVSGLFAQWEPDVRLTVNPETSFTIPDNADRCIAATGSVVHVVWMDTRDGNREIYYKRTTDNGSSWGPDTRLTNDPAEQSFASVAVSGSDVHVVWRDNRDSYWENYYKRSTDGGSTWDADTRLTDAPGGSGIPSVAAAGNSVHVVWYDDRDGNLEIYYKQSTDSGSSWGPDTRLTNDPAEQSCASVAVLGSNVYVVWRDVRDGNWEIWYKRSTDGGSTWGADMRLTDDPGGSGIPSVAVAASSVHVVWYDDRDGNLEIYYKRSTNSGSSWGPDTRLTDDSAEQSYPSVVASGSNVHVVWRDIRDGNWENYYNRSTDGGSTWGADTRLTNDPGGSGMPSVAVSGSVVHVVWYDDRDGNLEIYYKRNPTANPGITEAAGTLGLGAVWLDQNCPNPVLRRTVIRYHISREADVTLRVCNSAGRVVTTLMEGRKKPGTYTASWDVSGVPASRLPAGTYFCRLEAGEFAATRKMVKSE